ncbi:MAG: hypothetical protein ACK4TB_05325 [Gemmobacter sp.]
MMLTEVSAVPLAALPVEGLRDHLRLGSGFGDEGVQDALLAGYLRAALAAIEGRCAKALIARQFLWTVTAWRDDAGVALPLAPVVAVVSVVLRDGAGEAAAVDPARWRLAADMHRPRLLPRGGCLPRIPADGVAEVTFEAGFGIWDAVPPDLRQAVMMLAANFHEVRHEAGFREEGALPFGVMRLIERWRTVRVLGGGR